jgi:menaquinone-specific isochorismate synthase
MTILPLDPGARADPGALVRFLRECASESARNGRPRLVSISLEVDALDPLAVLESIVEPGQPHFYAERPDIGTALAGAEPAASHACGGPTRFRELQDWVDRLLEDAIAIGSFSAPFGGPHFFTGFTFAEEAEPGEPFPAAWAFVPRWQVARAGAGTTAVANLIVEADSDVEALAGRVLRAHRKFTHFEYSSPSESTASGQGSSASLKEVAGPGLTSAGGDYREAVRRALETIASGSLEKIVLARAIDLSATMPLHPLELLNGLRQRFPSCYSFSLANGRGQSFIGASPERLVRISKGTLETEALAGSAPRGAGASEDARLGASLLQSEKDLREQRLVLEMVVGRLSSLGLRAEYPAQPELHRLANVQHLRTPIRAELGGKVRLLQVLEALHPTPAVGGIPLEGALGAIREIEGFPRGLYAGALGWMNARGGGEFFVGLRSALVSGNRARLYAGAGIVAGSTPDREFAETELKFQAMREALLPARS